MQASCRLPGTTLHARNTPGHTLPAPFVGLQHACRALQHASQRISVQARAERRLLDRDYQFGDVYQVAIEKLKEKRSLPLPDMYQLVECVKSVDQANRCLDVLQRFLAAMAAQTAATNAERTLQPPMQPPAQPTPPSAPAAAAGAVAAAAPIMPSPPVMPTPPVMPVMSGPPTMPVMPSAPVMPSPPVMPVMSGPPTMPVMPSAPVMPSPPVMPAGAPAPPASSAVAIDPLQDWRRFEQDWPVRRRLLMRIAVISVTELKAPEMVLKMAGNLDALKVGTYFGKELILELSELPDAPTELLFRVAELVALQRGTGDKGARSAWMALIDVMQARGSPAEAIARIKVKMGRAVVKPRAPRNWSAPPSPPQTPQQIAMV